MAEILPIRRKILFNQSIIHMVECIIMHVHKLVCKNKIFFLHEYIPLTLNFINNFRNLLCTLNNIRGKQLRCLVCRCPWTVVTLQMNWIPEFNSTIEASSWLIQQMNMLILKGFFVQVCYINDKQYCQICMGSYNGSSRN